MPPRPKTLPARSKKEGPIPDPLSLLTPPQRRYVDARAAGVAPDKALAMAGQPRLGLDAMENNPAVKLALKYIHDKAMAELSVTRRDVIAGLMDAVRAATTSTELTAAWREIGKIIGAYEPQKIEVTHEMLLPEKLKVMSDRQLMVAAGFEGEVIDADFVEMMGDQVLP